MTPKVPSRRRALPVLSEREIALKAALDRVRATCDVDVRREVDPVALVHRYEAAHDRELVALAAACLAFGNVKALFAKIEDALRRVGPEVAKAAEDLPALRRKLAGWKHRLFRADDLARLLAGGRAVQIARGSLGAAFANFLEIEGDLRLALVRWTREIRTAGGLDRPTTRRGPAHLLADPSKGSASKRLHLFLRWMVRPADGIDFGMWNVDPSLLLVPVDTHVHKLAKNLGITRRRDVSWRTAEEITAKLARFDPADPVKYDFSLCHMGMVQRCPSRRDRARCDGCGVMPVCVHWATEPDRAEGLDAREESGSQRGEKPSRTAGVRAVRSLKER